jgi:putative DNA primase/helicase
MHQDFFEFKPTHKVFLAANHKPVIRGTDHAIWRRIRLIPFAVTIPESEQIPLAEMLDTLKQEWPGILAWAVEGCLAPWIKVHMVHYPRSVTPPTQC